MPKKITWTGGEHEKARKKKIRKKKKKINYLLDSYLTNAKDDLFFWFS
jgi:hypothetical protein